MQLIDNIGVPVIQHAPDVDETPRPQETPAELVERLSVSKAKSLATNYPNHLIVGSDQVAKAEGVILTKPGNHEAAFEQLSSCNGRRVEFLTGLCLYNSKTGMARYHCAKTEVKFRALESDQIRNYLHIEQPYDCAGSFKSEGLGICLFEYIRGDDPNALVGLPLISLVNLLAEEGIRLPLFTRLYSSDRP